MLHAISILGLFIFAFCFGILVGVLALWLYRTKTSQHEECEPVLQDSMMTGAIEIETEIAYQLEEIGGELCAIADQLRRKPFAVIEAQVRAQQKALNRVMALGNVARSAAIDRA